MDEGIVMDQENGLPINKGKFLSTINREFAFVVERKVVWGFLR